MPAAFQVHTAARPCKPTLSPQGFVHKWRNATLKERSAAQGHFTDLCQLVGHPTPAEYGPGGESFTFETFPFAWPPGKEAVGDARVQAVAEAARTLVEERDRWLNPPGASEEALAGRTLTNL